MYWNELLVLRLMNTPKIERQFIAYLWFVSWDCISLGLSICITGPHIEIHLPFCFLKIGWDEVDVNNEPVNHQTLLEERCKGLTERYKKKSWIHDS